MTRPDFGEDSITFNGVELTCKYIAPGLTLYDLTMIYEAAFNDPKLDRFSCSPSKWPTVAGVVAVTDAILNAIYPSDAPQKGN